MWRLFLFLVILSVGQYEWLFAQNQISGTILDHDTREPIPYVNIGIVEQLRGTVSDRRGAFLLSYESESDSVLFSAIGYKSSKIQVSDLISQPSILLNPEVYELDEIIVSERALGERRELGYNLKKRGHSVGFGSTLLGTEIGGLIQIDRETMIQSAHFTFNRTSSEPLLFRVNIYEFDGENPTRNLIPENVLVSSPKEPGTLTVDLKNYNITTVNDVLLSLEWVEAVTLDGSEVQEIAFRAERTRRRANVYFRSTSHAPFWTFDDYVKYHLGFYVTARQVR